MVVTLAPSSHFHDMQDMDIIPSMSAAPIHLAACLFQAAIDRIRQAPCL